MMLTQHGFHRHFLTALLFVHCAGGAQIFVSRTGAPVAEVRVPPSQSAFPAVVEASAAPAPEPHFTTGTYGLLRSSGDRVRVAVQRVLGVQGSLDELKEDLSAEYRRWKTKQQELVARRQQAQLQIQQRQAALLQQRALADKAGRLRGDLAVLAHASRSQNETQRQRREAWEKKEKSLRGEIHTFLKEVESVRQESWATVTAFHNHTDALRKNGSAAAVDAIKANKTIREFEEARARHVFNTSREQSALLKELLGWQKQQGTVKHALQVQAELQWEYGRLADQAHEVLKRRENVHVGRQSCDAAQDKLHEELTESSEAMQEDTKGLRRCQLQQALNQQMQNRANECRAAAVTSASQQQQQQQQ